METRAIPADQWSDYCARFARQHRGWLATLSRLPTADLQTGEPVVAEAIYSDNRPLTDIRARRGEDGVEVMITLGGDDGDSALRVEDVVTLHSRRLAGADEGLRIDSRDGTSTLLEFRAAADPEALDGLADSER